MQDWHSIVTLIVVIGAPALGIYFYIKAYGGENGERHAKMRMQGPFVPDNESDATVDEEPIRT